VAADGFQIIRAGPGSGPRLHFNKRKFNRPFFRAFLLREQRLRGNLLLDVRTSGYGSEAQQDAGRRIPIMFARRRT
jgi:hypothetical protein